MTQTGDLNCYLILSLDGGGVRGALQARILDRLEQALPFVHKVQLIAGSSVGAINGLCLAAGADPAELVELYSTQAGEIFGQRDWLDTLAGPTDELLRANYDNIGLRRVVEARLGDHKLSDLGKKVVVTSFDLDNLDQQSRDTATRVYRRRFWKPKIFHNYDSPGNDGAQLAVDVALRSSAAPTFFPAHQGYVDGGIVANNPSMCAIGRAVKSGVSLDRIVMVSVGTGISPVYVTGDRLDWGLKQWAPHLLPMFMDGMVGIPDYICEQLLPKRYVRLQPFLSDEVDLDDVGRVDDLIEQADTVEIGPAVELLASLPA